MSGKILIWLREILVRTDSLEEFKTGDVVNEKNVFIMQ